MRERVLIRAEVGARIRSERRRLGLNQSDFGRLASVSRRTQAGYESGEGAPDAEYLAALANAGVDILFVITGRPGGGVAEEPHSWRPAAPVTPVGPLSAEEEQLVARFRTLGSGDRAVIQRLARSLADGDTQA